MQLSNLYVDDKGLFFFINDKKKAYVNGCTVNENVFGSQFYFLGKDK